MRPLLACLLATTALFGCPATTSTETPGWTRTTLEYGQGAFNLGVRFRWVASRDSAGASVETPEGGRATVRVFQCGQSMKALKRLLRQRLRGRLIGGELAQTKSRRVVAWRWRTEGGEAGQLSKEARTYHSAVQLHGPLLIAVTSSNIQLEDVELMASKVRLSMPVPFIKGCYPICIGREKPCALQKTGPQ